MRMPNHAIAVDDERCSLVRKLALCDMDAIGLHGNVAEVAEKDDLVIWVTALFEG